jgi:uncharacterized membrane protein YbhN (UPF0104 family)
MSEKEQIQIRKTKPGVSRALGLLLKIGITILCFWYISKKINFSAAITALMKAKWLYLFFALMFFILSKIFSSLRLNINFRNIGLHLSEKKNLKLYLLGMFYNLFLPGAISGDAYKVILLHRKYRAPYKKTSVAVLLDRFSGVLALGLILSVYSLAVLPARYTAVCFTGSILALLAFYLVVRFVLKDFLPGFLPTFFWGLAVQVCQVLSVYLILSSLNISWKEQEWIFIFLVSAVVSVLPVSLGGGLGTREFIFTEGSLFFHRDPQLGVAVSLLFYLITVVGSVGGVYFSFHDPLLE